MLISIRKRINDDTYVLDFNGLSKCFETLDEIEIYFTGEIKSMESAFDSAMETTKDWESREREIKKEWSKANAG